MRISINRYAHSAIYPSLGGNSIKKDTDVILLAK